MDLLELATLKAEARSLSGPARRELERYAEAVLAGLANALHEQIGGELLEELSARLDDGGVGGDGAGEDRAGEGDGRRLAGGVRRPATSGRGAVVAGRVAATATPAATAARATRKAKTRRAAAANVVGVAKTEPTGSSAASGRGRDALALAGTAASETAADAIRLERAEAASPNGARMAGVARAGEVKPARPALGFYKVRGEIFVVGQTTVWLVQSRKLADRNKPERRDALPAGARPSGPPPFAYVPRFCWE